MLFCNVNVEMFGPYVLDCYVETQYTSKDAFQSQTVWAYSFDSLFSLFDAF